MFNKKSIITVIAISVLIIAVSAGLMYINANKEVETPVKDLPTVVAVVAQEVTEAPTVEGFIADVPENGIDVSTIPDASAEEVAEMEAYEEANPFYAETAEEIVANEVIVEEFKNEVAKTLPAGTPTAPVVVEKPVVEVTKDANGFIMTKEEAVKKGAIALQAAIDSNSFSWNDCYPEMIKNGMTDEEIFTWVEKAKNDPYSTKYLAGYYDQFRRDGNGVWLSDCIIAWIYNGGDNGTYNGFGL